MSKDAVFKMMLAPQLRAELMAEAEAAHQPTSQVVHEPVRELVRHQRSAMAYDGSVRADMVAGRVAMRAAVVRSNDKVDAGAAPRRFGAART